MREQIRFECHYMETLKYYRLEGFVGKMPDMVATWEPLFSNCTEDDIVVAAETIESRFVETGWLE